jgi:hypothetical protein
MDYTGFSTHWHLIFQMAQPDGPSWASVSAIVGGLCVFIAARHVELSFPLRIFVSVVSVVGFVTIAVSVCVQGAV